MPSGRRKLLLADDSPTIQKVVSLTFGDEGLEVVAVGDGEAALRALAEEPPPDVLLADVLMPGPDGYELCERVKRDARLRDMPVVLLVGAFEPFNEAEARRVGADTVLTKPFQSIRDLVSKVGSLLGGGGDATRHEEEEAARARDERRAPAAEPPRPHARDDEDARAVAAEEPRRAEPDASFADLGADDELIEAKSADAFGAAPEPRPRAEGAPAFAETFEPGFLATTQREESGFAAVAAAAAPAESFASGADAFAGWDEERAVSRVPEGQAEQTEQTEEAPMQETTSPRTSSDARAESAAAADDSLLDIGREDAHAAAAAPADDDFILDLDDLDLGDEAPAARASSATDDADVLEEPARAPAQSWADAPSAFAEAAHGESASARAEAAPSFGSASTSFEMSSPSSEASAADESWHDVVVQDGPQGFAFGGEEPQALGSAPRGFIEPEVVPADEPVPAAVPSEFTDGSVEGDTPKTPVAQTSAEVPARETSAAGFAVGEARSGLEGSPSAARLSREEIDAIARRVVEMMSDKVVREIAWEVVPELAELLIRQKLEEERRR